MTTTLKQFIRQHKIRMTAEWADSNPNMMTDENWSRSATHYRCVLRCGKRQMTVPFSQGSAHTKEPSAEDVLNCLASDAAGYENARSFEDWCSEYGYDTDSRKAEKTFKTIERQATDLARLLGAPSSYETLLWNTERL